MIETYLLQRYPGELEKTIAHRGFIADICRQYIGCGLEDRDFEPELCSENNARHWQRLSEALIAHEFLALGINLQPSHGGPDLLVQHDGRKIWIEVICPEPTGIPEAWLQPSEGKAFAVPHEAILLRWTAAIKEKSEKLLGNPARKISGYLEKGVVSVEDSYVIAVNGRLLRGPNFASIAGVSQCPYAAEAAFSVGPFAVRLNRDSLEITGSGHLHRPMVEKPNGRQVPANTFLDPAFRQVSAIMAAGLDGTYVIGNFQANRLGSQSQCGKPGSPRAVTLLSGIRCGSSQ